MLFSGPLRHVIAAFCDQPQDRVRAEAVNLREIGSCQRIKRASQGEVGLVTLSVPVAGLGHGDIRAFLVLVQLCHGPFYLYIALVTHF